MDKATGPEVRAQALFRDRYVGVVRAAAEVAIRKAATDFVLLLQAASDAGKQTALR